MSNLQEAFQNNSLRFLIYGPPKARKTWWASTAAEAGFNLILLNADNNLAVLRYLSDKAKDRVSVINIFDTATKARCSVFLTAFLRQKAFVWDNTERMVVQNKSELKQTSSHFIIDPTRLTLNDVVVLDSWTKNAHSLLVRYCNENNINLAEAEEENNKWDGFRWMKAVAEWQMNQLQLLKSHVVVIGHQNIYEKMRHEKQGKRTVQIVEWQRVQPVSTSGPAAMHLANHFTDVLYFEIAGELTRINTQPSKDRDGGSTIVPPRLFEFRPGGQRTDKYLDFQKVCEFAKINLPNSTDQAQAARYFPVGAEVPFEDIIPSALRSNQKIIQAAKPAEASKPASLTNLTKPKLQETAK